MPSRDSWKTHFEAAASIAEDDVARDVSGAIDTVFIKRKIPRDIDFVPSDDPWAFIAERWKEVLNDVADVLNVYYGMAAFVSTLKFATETVSKPLHTTMTLITVDVIAALQKAREQ